MKKKLKQHSFIKYTHTIIKPFKNSIIFLPTQEILFWQHCNVMTEMSRDVARKHLYEFSSYCQFRFRLSTSKMGKNQFVLLHEKWYNCMYVFLFMTNLVLLMNKKARPLLTIKINNKWVCRKTLCLWLNRSSFFSIC